MKIVLVTAVSILGAWICTEVDYLNGWLLTHYVIGAAVGTLSATI